VEKCHNHVRILMLLLNKVVSNAINGCPGNAGKVAIGARIIKGQSAHRGEFPWQVGIIVNDENFCGGSLISRSHVLTAAHCVYKYAY
jgi:secreted trypsin-like serine protease